MKRILKNKTNQVSFLFLLFSLLLNTTTFAQGVVIDDEIYDNLPSISFNDGKGGKSSEIKHTQIISMKDKVPEVINQRGASCVPAAFCYNAMTIEYANKLDLTRDQLNGIAFSYMFVYNQVERKPFNCGATEPSVIGQFLEKNGDCLKSEYDTDICDADPSYSLKLSAQKHRIKGFSKLFDRQADRDKKLEQVQSALISGRPVPIVIQDFYGFNAPRKDDFFTYTGNTSNKNEAHAMVVIGYDNYKESFEIVNTHGKNWGDGGFSYIKYDEFVKYCSHAYLLHVDIRTKDTGDTPSPTNPPKTINYNGSFKLQSMTRFSPPKVVDAQKTNTYVYELTKKDWKIGDLFQLSLNKAKEGQVVYVFSIDEKGVNIHWPRALSASDKDLNNFHDTDFVGAGEVPFIPFEDCELIIPGNGNVMFRQAKEDHIIVLFAHKPIDNFVERVIKVNKAIGSIQQRFEVGFKDLVIPQQEINYKSDQMSFSAQTDNEEGIIPMIVSMEGQ